VIAFIMSNKLTITFWSCCVLAHKIPIG